MSQILLNLVSALSIGLIIGVMATIKNAQLKATVYALPIPITIALIATHGKISDDNVVGLVLLCGFLWLVYWFHNMLKLHVIFADVLSALLYVLIGYIGIKIIEINFWIAVLIFLASWFVVMTVLKTYPLKHNSDKASRLSPLTKGIGTSIIGFGLLSLKNTLSAIVVTFPFSGVFAVLETKSNLKVLATIFTRNSLAILGLFITVYVVPNLAIGLSLGWLIYLLVFQILQQIKL